MRQVFWTLFAVVVAIKMIASLEADDFSSNIANGPKPVAAAPLGQFAKLIRQKRTPEFFDWRENYAPEWKDAWYKINDRYPIGDYYQDGFLSRKADSSHRRIWNTHKLKEERELTSEP